MRVGKRYWPASKAKALRPFGPRFLSEVDSHRRWLPAQAGANILIGKIARTRTPWDVGRAIINTHGMQRTGDLAAVMGLIIV